MCSRLPKYDATFQVEKFRNQRRERKDTKSTQVKMNILKENTIFTTI